MYVYMYMDMYTYVYVDMYKYMYKCVCMFFH